MTVHRVASIQFPPGQDIGPCECTCGWFGVSSSFTDHRTAKGAPAVHTDRAAYDPDHSGSWDNAPAVQGRMPRPRPTPEERTSEPCAKGHEPRWRIHKDGKRRCLTCDSERARARRAECRAA